MKRVVSMVEGRRTRMEESVSSIRMKSLALAVLDCSWRLETWASTSVEVSHSPLMEGWRCQEVGKVAIPRGSVGGSQGENSDDIQTIEPEKNLF